MSAATSQAVLCGALRYFQKGEIATLRHIIDRVWPDKTQTDAFFQINLLTAINIAGLVDLLDSDQKRAWWTVFSDDIEIRGSSPKIVPTTHTSLQRREGSLTPLICTSEGAPLVLGLHVPPDDDSDQATLFNQTFGSRLQPFKQIERFICEPESYIPSAGDTAQRYDPDRHVWIEAEERLDQPSLIRSRLRFGGTRLFIWYPDLALRFRILRPEWAFVAATHFLGPAFKPGFRADGARLIVQRAFLLPAILLRFLFACCQTLRVGRQLEFIGVAPYALATIESLFLVGEANAS